MKAKELIEKLKKIDPESDVRLSSSKYGPLDSEPLVAARYFNNGMPVVYLLAESAT